MSTSEVLGESATIAAINAWNGAVVYTIGHSTRPQAELVDLLHHYKVTTLADVRTVPRSRHNPQFNRDELITALPEVGIAYVHLAALGGLRRGLGDASPNKGWRNQSFRGYADHMQSPEFAVGLEELRAVTKAGPVAVMCAEAVPWRCHRSLIADALLIRGVETADIQSLTHILPHALTQFAHVEGLQITYPADLETNGDPKDEDAGQAG
ncbi:MAG TPA: DUF488 domain-containing protein [Thermomicrobiales bacterium]|nr:DUF488 domain-containing protein [Thermomicrobiales bacterium]